MFRINKIALFLFILSCTSLAHARRRSRIDSPIKNASEAAAPIEGLQQQQQQDQTEQAPLKLPVTTTLQSELSESSDVASNESTSSEELQDCDNIDNISFELVTG